MLISKFPEHGSTANSRALLHGCKVVQIATATVVGERDAGSRHPIVGVSGFRDGIAGRTPVDR